MPFEDAADYRFNPFDLTKVWPHADYPLITVGRIIAEPQPGELLRRDRAGRLRARPTWCRASGSRPDKMLLGRLFAYADTHRYRIDTAVPTAFPIGRKPSDDVVQTLLTLITNEQGTVDDSVATNDKLFETVFPYLALPHQPRDPGVDDGTQN